MSNELHEQRSEQCVTECQMERRIPGACGGLCQFLRWELIDAKREG